MMSPLSEQNWQSWLDGVRPRLKRFVRDDLFALTATPDREWWASVIEDVDSTVKKIEALLASAVQSRDGCLEASRARSKRVGIKGKQVYAYQLVHWAGNALIPSNDDVVRHKCHNRRCINPIHLTHGSQLENINDTRDR